jgi:hypothetical protein
MCQYPRTFSALIHSDGINSSYSSLASVWRSGWPGEIRPGRGISEDSQLR